MSSLIVLGIVGIWILVLVPMWLNRHDADSASRSMDTFSTAMRVLSRRGPSRTRFGRADRSDRTADGQYLVLPRDDWGVTVDNQIETSTTRRRLRVPLHLPSRRQSYATSGRAQLIARRRRIAVGFAVLVIGLALSAEFVHTSWWFELGAGLALAGYLIHLRTEAIRTSEMRRRRLARAARAAAPYPTARTAGGERYYAARVRHDDADVKPVAAAEAVSTSGTVSAFGTVSASGTEDGSRWEPIAVPLPTYVSKPVVSRPATAAPRADVASGPLIDLTQPGKWIDSQVDVRHLLLDDEAPEADELDVILARRRAVNH
ncbi:MAG TPA: hypothetical protein VIJ31_11795 [Acidothermaceae bacterium]